MTSANELLNHVHIHAQAQVFSGERLGVARRTSRDYEIRGAKSSIV